MSVRMGCPYIFCSAVIEASWMRTSPSNPRAERLMVPAHDIRHSWITGACPASLMWIPLDRDAIRVLTERAHQDRRDVIQRMAEQDTQEPPDRDHTARRGGMFPQRPMYPRGPGRLPGRMGREPGPHSGTWNPPRPGDPQNQPVPPGLGGQPLGGRAMASIREVVAQVTEANVQTGEAAASVAECVHVLGAAKESMESASGQIAAAIDGAGVETLGEYAGLLRSAIEAVDAAIPSLDEASRELTAGMEKGETYIGHLMA